MSAHHAEKKSHHQQEQKDFLERKDRQMFMELGMVAATNFLPWEAHAFFGQLLHADHLAAYPRIGLAHCKIMGGQFEDAHKLLKEEAVSSSPLKAYGIALRALAFHLAKQPRELNELLQGNQELLNNNPPALQFLKSLLEISNNH
ncbi:MAG: hypothetical protein K2W99_04280 [Chthoniobacterales bacterium]|nr:hypothetical protein [Chthoniobacterales bacterium]